MIRYATAKDAAGITAIYAPIVAQTSISFETEPPTIAEMRGRIDKLMPQYPWIVDEEDLELNGYAYASPHSERSSYRWSVNVAIYVAPHARRSGVARGLYEALFEILEAQGFVTAYAGITLPNEASVRLHESLGFSPIGVYRRVGWKLGAWHDVGWWERAICEHFATPRPPLPLTELDGNPKLPWFSSPTATSTPRVGSTT